MTDRFTPPPEPLLRPLLPCPFCGGAATQERHPWHAESIRLGCANEACAVAPRTEYLLACYADELLAAWNGRPATAAGGSGVRSPAVAPPA